MVGSPSTFPILAQARGEAVRVLTRTGERRVYIWKKHGKEEPVPMGRVDHSPEKGPTGAEQYFWTPIDYSHGYRKEGRTVRITCTGLLRG